VRWLPSRHQAVPRGVTLDVSLDAERWRRVVAVPHYMGLLYWSANRPMARVRSGRLRSLRIVLTRSDAVFDWSVHELAVYGAAPAPADPAPRS
jgi:hypothetical protein